MRIVEMLGEKRGAQSCGETKRERADHEREETGNPVRRAWTRVECWRQRALFSGKMRMRNSRWTVLFCRRQHRTEDRRWWWEEERRKRGGREEEGRVPTCLDRGLLQNALIMIEPHEIALRV